MDLGRAARCDQRGPTGGLLISDAQAQAQAFWIVADPEGNEVCLCTWQDRD